MSSSWPPTHSCLTLDICPLCSRQAPVEAVLAQHDHALVVQPLHDLVTHSSFAAGCATCRQAPGGCSWPLQQLAAGHRGLACHSNEEACPPSKGGPAPQWARACISKGQVGPYQPDAIQVWGSELTAISELSSSATHYSQRHTYPRGSHSSSWESDYGCLVGWWVPRCHGHWQCSAASDP